MENNDTKMRKSEIKQFIFLILLAVAVGALLFTCIILVKNAKEIKSDPVEYAVSNDFYDSCTCFKEGVGIVKFLGENQVIENWTV